MKIPLVSAVISTYNSEKFIKGRLEDLLQQSIVDSLEIIVVNSGSQENEEEIVQDFITRHPNIQYLKTGSRETIYAAWNKGIRIAKGKFITNANTDDRLRSDALEALSQHLLEHPDAAMVYADQYISTAANAPFSGRGTIQRWNNFQYDRLLEGCFTGPQPMWRASLHFEDNLWFDERCEVAGDYEFSCKTALRYRLHHLPEALGSYYLSPHAANKQFQDTDRSFEETYAIKSEYADAYLRQLNEKEFFGKYSYYTRWIGRNIFYYYIWKLLLKILNPDKRLPVRDFACWYAARMKRILGDSLQARNICEEYLAKKKSRLLDRERSELTQNPASEFLISVIIPTYNRPALLREALESIDRQTCKASEVIVINNGTTDVADVVEEFAKRIPVRLINSTISGSVARAKNIGIRSAQGSYIAFLDDDDWFHPNHLQTLKAALEKGTHLFAYTDAFVEFQDEKDGRLTTVKKIIMYSRDFSRKLLLVKDYIFTPCIMVSRKCFDTAGFFDESLRTDEDMDLWIRMSKYYDFQHIKKVTCSVRRSNAVESLTRDWGMMYHNLRYVYAKHRALSRYNILVLLGQLYYLNLRIRRAKNSKNGAFKYEY